MPSRPSGVQPADTREAHSVPPGTGGRPRRFDPEVEREMLLDAGIRVMVRDGFAATSVSDVLREAGVSTRSFYRHFESKDALVSAVVRREAEAVHDRLMAIVDFAPGPVEALEAWLDATLDLFFDRRHSARTNLFTTPEVVRSSRIPEELTELRELVFGPLVAVLREGHATGELSSPNPRWDALTIFELVSSAAQASGIGRRSRQAARAHVVRFAWPALGLS